MLGFRRYLRRRGKRPSLVGAYGFAISAGGPVTQGAGFEDSDDLPGAGNQQRR